MATEHQKFEIAIDPAYTKEERQAIADDIVDYIRERTKKGLGIGGKKNFAKYSDAYEKSINFKIAGKTPGQTPDLTQSGDMLGAMDLLSDSEGKLVIGFENGSRENAIADGNIRGTYGHKSPVGPKRDFLGVTKKELAEILKEYPLSDKRKRAETITTERMTKTVVDKIKTDLHGEETVAIPTFHGEDT